MKQSLYRGLAFVAMLCCSSAFALTNLVQNPGFESGVAGWRSGGGSGATIDSIAGAKSGTKSLKMTPNSNEHTVLYQKIPVTPGKVYTLSVWIKQEGDPGPGSDASSFLYYQYLDASGYKTLSTGYIKYIKSPTSTYTETKNYSLAPDSSVTLQIELRTSNPKVGYQNIGHFDDVSVVADEYITNKVNLLNNPGFESGTTAGWSGINSNVTASTERPRSGSYALRVNNAGGFATVTQSIPVTPGDGVGFTGYACLRSLSGDSFVNTTTNLTTAYFYASFASAGYDANTIDISNLDNHASYSRTTHETIVPAGASNFWVQCWVYQGGPYLGFFDDIKVIKFTKNPNPPGVSPLSLSKPKSSSVLNGTVTDILGRRLTDLQNNSIRNGLTQRVANGVYFTIVQPSKTVARTARMDANSK